VQWASFRHDNHNTGNFDTPLPMQPGPSAALAGCGCHTANSAEGAMTLMFYGLLIAGFAFTRRRFH
jgi:hypothetical protein